MFFVDIQKSQIDELKTLIAERAGEEPEITPTVRARIAAVNGEAIYGTRPWRVFGEGPTEVAEGAFTDTKRAGFTAHITGVQGLIIALALMMVVSAVRPSFPVRPSLGMT